MVFFNWATMQMAAKIVYYGPGLCGKTSNLSYIYAKTSPKSRGEMVSLETESDRTLFFDLLPIEVGTIGGFKTRLQLYTVPGQVFYNTTRKLVLKGVDGLVFVADSQRPMREANIESFKSLMANIEELGLEIGDLPLVLQFNKRDLDNILSIEELNLDLNAEEQYSWHPASAINGEGVFETLKEITKVTLKKLKARMAAPSAPEPPPKPAVAESPAPPPPSTPAPQSRPISASALARAAEEGAGDDFPVAAMAEAADVGAEAGFGDASPPSELQGPEDEPPPTVVDVAEEPTEELTVADEIEFEVEDEVVEVEVEVEDEVVEIDDAPSANEVTATSLGGPPTSDPFDQYERQAADSVDTPELELEPEDESAEIDEVSPLEPPEPIEPQEGVEPQEVVEAVEPIEDMETEVEFDTGTTELGAVEPPPLKRVKVSDETDILAQLEGLRREATEAASDRPRRGTSPGLDLDSLLGSGSPEVRDVKRRFEHRLNSNLFQRMSSMQVAFRIQDSDGETIHTLDPISVNIDDASSLQKLILQLTVDLENLG